MPEFSSTVEGHYRRIYFEAVDLVMVAINNWFDQKGFKMFVTEVRNDCNSVYEPI